MKHRLRSHFDNFRLQTKFFCILLMALLLVLAGTFTASYMPYGAYNEQIYAKSVQLLTLFAQEIQTDLNALTEISYFMIGDNVLQSALSTMRKAELGSQRWVAARREVDDRIAYFSFLNTDILSVRLRSLDGTIFTRTPRGDTVSTSMLSHLTELALKAKGREVWVPDPSREGTLLLVRDVREIEDLTLNSIGLITMRIDLGRIVVRKSASLRAMEMPLTTAIYAGGVRLYASDAEIALLEMEEDGFSIHDVGGTSMLCVRYTEPAMDWTYITAVPYGSIMRSISGATRTALGIALAVLVLALGISSMLVASILRHLDVLLGKYDAFARGEHARGEERSPYRDRRDEIGRLHNHFDRMAADYEKMIEENYVKQQLLLEAQVRQLRAQIQPHFLYNTLESIYCLAEMGGDPRIATMTDALGKMLRATLRDTRDIITIAEDMRIAQDYLKIQLIRLGDRLHATFLVEAPFERVRIPAMTLQPLVENAVRHAAEETLDSCEIHVYCRRVQEGRVELVVRDNGPGVEEEILEKLERGEMQAEGLGIGLRNIHRRLGLAFSDAYGLRITREGDWTNVIVCLPGEEEAHEAADR